MSLTLTPLPAHPGLIVSFDVFVIHSWDGNDPAFGPDLWSLSVGGGPTLLQTTFSTIDFAVGGAPFGRNQAYADTFPGGDHPARAAAA